MRRSHLKKRINAQQSASLESYGDQFELHAEGGLSRGVSPLKLTPRPRPVHNSAVGGPFPFGDLEPGGSDDSA
jgi:hypothetical protein